MGRRGKSFIPPNILQVLYHYQGTQSTLWFGDQQLPGTDSRIFILYDRQIWATAGQPCSHTSVTIRFSFPLHPSILRRFILTTLTRTTITSCIQQMEV